VGKGVLESSSCAFNLLLLGARAELQLIGVIKESIIDDPTTLLASIAWVAIHSTLTLDETIAPIAPNYYLTDIG